MFTLRMVTLGIMIHTLSPSLAWVNLLLPCREDCDWYQATPMLKIIRSLVRACAFESGAYYFLPMTVIQGQYMLDLLAINMAQYEVFL